MSDSRNIQELTAIFRESSRRYGCRRVGIEVERVAFTPEGRSLPYDAEDGKPSAHSLLDRLGKHYGWPAINSTLGKPIGLEATHGKVSLEPGSQLEFSTEPLEGLRQVKDVLFEFEGGVDDVVKDWNLGWITLGLNPLEAPEDKIVIPAPRYHIMSEYLPTKDTLPLAMMRLSTSVQVNLDYTCEAEGIEMLRVALLAAPISYALFANSPIYKGQRTDYLSFRGHIWEHTDPDRQGLFPQAFESNFDFESYARFVYRMPLMFAEDNSGKHVATNGASLADVAAGKLKGVSLNNSNRISAVRQVFTEARLKPGYVEVRSIDGQSARYRYAATAFWMGLLYDQNARELVIRSLMRYSPEQRRAWHSRILKEGLRAVIEGVTTQSIAEELFAAAYTGLQRRGLGEEIFLEPVRANLSKGLCPADHIVRLYEEKCKQNLNCLIHSSARCHEML